MIQANFLKLFASLCDSSKFSNMNHLTLNLTTTCIALVLTYKQLLYGYVC